MFKLELSSDEINDLKEGGDETYKKIFRLVYRLLCYYIYDMSNGANDGEDIVQDTFAKFYERRSNFSSAGEIMSFLGKTSRNAYLNVVKHKKVEQKHRKFIENESETSEPVSVKKETEMLHALHTEIENLPDKCKEIFKLLYYQRLSTQEVADRLNITTSNVSHQKGNAIQQLRKNLNKRFLLILLMVAFLGLKFFPGNFSIISGLLVQYYVTATNHKYH
jgi:RNA polymerase sigma-70 factor (ECF subfamily)